MYSILKKYLKQILSPKARNYLKKSKRYLLSIIRPFSKSSIQELEYILKNELKIEKGDFVFVTSGFGYLNATYSPEDLICLLQSIVTNDGLIMMPFYPRLNSDECASSNHVFDMKSTVSGMGILTNVFSKMPDVYKSCHPTKAVCVWGNCAEDYIKGHEYSETPYYIDSPYGKLLKNKSKSIGLAVNNMPMIHAVEDAILGPGHSLYYKEKVNMKVVRLDSKVIEVPTYIHNPVAVSHCVSAYKYIERLGVPIKKVRVGLTSAFSVDNSDVYVAVQSDYLQGNTTLRAKK